jgi:hypothetical protein
VTDGYGAFRRFFDDVGYLKKRFKEVECLIDSLKEQIRDLQSSSGRSPANEDKSQHKAREEESVLDRDPTHRRKKFRDFDGCRELSEVARETGIARSTIEYWANKDANASCWFLRLKHPGPHNLVNVSSPQLPAKLKSAVERVLVRRDLAAQEEMQPQKNKEVRAVSGPKRAASCDRPHR